LKPDVSQLPGRDVFWPGLMYLPLRLVLLNVTSLPTQACVSGLIVKLAIGLEESCIGSTVCVDEPHGLIAVTFIKKEFGYGYGLKKPHEFVLYDLEKMFGGGWENIVSIPLSLLSTLYNVPSELLEFPLRSNEYVLGAHCPVMFGGTGIDTAGLVPMYTSYVLLERQPFNPVYVTVSVLEPMLLYV
jgi:hypothetical protein